jgi:zinc transporter 1
MLEITKTNKLIAVLAIAAAFFATEIAVGFLTRSLALVADAFHIMSDIIGYIVAIIAVKLAGTATPSIRFTYGYQRAEVIGAFFNGGEALVGLADVAFLMALGVSVILQSIERFIEPAEVTDPVLVMAIGAAGIGSNALMLLVLGGEPLLCHADPGHGHDHSSPAETAQPTDGHSGHAHVRRAAPIKGRDLNILGVLIHILGDALNSIAVSTSPKDVAHQLSRPASTRRQVSSMPILSRLSL